MLAGGHLCRRFRLSHLFALTLPMLQAPSHPPAMRPQTDSAAIPQPGSGAAATRQQRELESRANRIANDHARQVREYLRFRKLGLSRATAASEVGRATGTLDKWLVRYKAGGVAALRPNLSTPIGRRSCRGWRVSCLRSSPNCNGSPWNWVR